MGHKKKANKRFSGAFLCALIIGIMLPVALNALTLHRGPDFKIFSITSTEHIVTGVKKFADGQYAYCLERKKDTPSDGTDLPSDGILEDANIWKTLKYGYPNQKWYNTGNTAKDEKLNYYVTQTVVWSFLEGWSDAKIDTFTQASSGMYPAITTDIPTLKKHVKALRAQVKADTSHIAPSVDFAPKTITMEGNNSDVTKSELITVTGVNLTGKATVTLSGAPTGSYVENEAGNKTNKIDVGGKFRIVVPSRSAKSSFTFSIEAGGTSIRTVKYEGGSYQDLVKYEEMEVTTPAATKGTINWTPGVGTSKIKKVDSDSGAAISGVVFDIKKGDAVAKTVTTGADGTAEFELPVGDYTVVEKSAPPQYVVDPTPHPITVKNTGEVHEISIKNTVVKATIKVLKVDTETKEPLPGAKFKLTQNGQTKYEATSGADGRATFSNVVYGNYKLEEVEAPEGYLRDNASRDITVDSNSNGKTFDLEAPNQVIKGKIQIVKIDANDEERPVEGAVFELYKASDLNKAIAKLTTDKNGFAYTEDLRYGDYVLKEVDAPGDYYINDKLYPVSIRENGKVEVKYIVNKPVEFRLQIVKVDGETQQPLEGAHFQIHQNGKPVEFTYQAGNKVVKETTFVSDSEGMILLPTTLRGGKYQLVEVKAPVGYKPIDPIDFEITRDTQLDKDELGNIFKIEVKNDIIKGNVELIKVDSAETEKKLEGVKFELYKTSKVPDTAGESEDKTDAPVEEETEDNLVEKAVKSIKRLFTKEGEQQPPTEGESNDTQPPTNEGEQQPPVEGEEQTPNEEQQPSNEWSENLLTEEQKPLENGDQLIGLYATDSNGSIRVNDLKFGDYYFKEVETVEGYVLSEEPVGFQVTEDGKKLEVTAQNRKIEGKVEISKEDVSTGEGLPDTGIRIYLEDKETVVYEGRTNSDGKLVFGPLEYGKYYFQEFDAPEGYVIDETLFPFEIKEDGEIVKCRMTNKKIEGTLEITKVDVSDGKLLPDTTFAIYDETGKEVVVKGKTDQNGIAKFKLQYGKYYYQEIEAPEGYLIDNTKFPFEIKEDGEIVKCKMTNSKLPKTGTVPVSTLAIGAPVAVIGLAGAYAFFKKQD